MNSRFGVVRNFGSALLIAPALLLTGCPETPVTDAGVDSGAVDMGRADTGPADTGPSDTGPVDMGTIIDVPPPQDVPPPTDVPVVVDVRADAPADAPADAGGGMRTDPMHSYLYYPSVMVLRVDTTSIGGPPAVTTVFSVQHPGAVAPPDDMAGDCIYHNLGITGDAARNVANNLNIGPMTTVQTGAMSTRIDITFDATRMQYVSDTTMARPLIPNVPITLNVTGGPDGPAGMSTLTFPPNVLPTNVTPPTSFSRTMNNEVLYDVPPEATADTTAVFWVFSMMRDKVIVCTVPSNRGSFNVPGSMIAHYAVGAQFQWFVWMQRIAVVPPATRTPQPMDFTIMNGSSFYGMVTP